MSESNLKRDADRMAYGTDTCDYAKESDKPLTVAEVNDRMLTENDELRACEPGSLREVIDAAMLAAGLKPAEQEKMTMAELRTAFFSATGWPACNIETGIRAIWEHRNKVLVD